MGFGSRVLARCLGAVCVVMMVVGVSTSAEAQQRRQGAAQVAQALTPVEQLAQRLGLGQAPSVSAQTTGNTRTWRNLRLGTAEDRQSTVATTTLELLPTGTAERPEFRLVMNGLTDEGGAIGSIELVGSFQGTLPLSAEGIFEADAFKGFVGTLKVRGVALVDGEGTYSVGSVDATFAPGGPDGGRLTDFSMRDLALKGNVEVMSTLEGVDEDMADLGGLSDGPIEIKIASMTLAGLNEAGWTAMVKSGSLRDETDDADTPKDEAVDLARQKEVLAAARQMAFSRFEITGTEVSGEGIVVGLGRYTVVGMSPQKIDLFEMADIRFSYKEEAPAADGANSPLEEPAPSMIGEATFTTRRIALTNIKTQPVFTAIEAFSGDEAARARPISQDFTGGPMDNWFDTASIEAVAVDIMGISMTLDQLASQSVRAPDGYVTGTTSPLATLRIKVSDDPNGEPTMQQIRSMMVTVLGEPEFRMSWGGSFQMDRATGVMSLSDMKLTLQDSFDIGVELALGGVDRMMAAMTYDEVLGIRAMEKQEAEFAELMASIAAADAADEAAGAATDADTAAEDAAAAAAAAVAEAAAAAVADEAAGVGDDTVVDMAMPAIAGPFADMEETNPAMFAHLAIVSARVALQDRGLMEKVFTGIATMSGEPAAQMRNQMADLVAPARNNDPDTRDFFRKLSRFIREGGGFSVALLPQAPIPFRTIEEPGAVKPTDVRTIWRDPRAK